MERVVSTRPAVAVLQGNVSHSRQESRSAVSVLRWEIGSSEERLERGRQKHSHGPPAATGGRLDVLRTWEKAERCVAQVRSGKGKGKGLGEFFVRSFVWCWTNRRWIERWRREKVDGGKEGERDGWMGVGAEKDGG